MLQVKKKYESKTLVMNINVHVLLYICLFWAFFTPAYFNRINILSYFSKTCQMLSYCYFVFWLCKKKWKGYHIEYILLVLLYVELVIATLGGRGSTISSVVYALPEIVLCAFICNVESEEKLYVIKALFYIHFVLMVANLASVIFFPEGLYTVERSSELQFFLGHKNSATRVLVPAMAYAMMYDLVKRNSYTWRSYLTGVLAFITVTLTWSNTGMIAIGILLIFLLFFKNKIASKLVSAKLFLGIGVGLFVILVGLQSISRFSYIITTIFKKSMTLSGRTYIWTAGISAIAKKPILGYGYGVDVWTTVNMGALEPTGLHNYFLDLMFRGGVIQLVIQLALVIVICIKLDKNNDKFSKMLSFVMLSYFFMWQLEVFIKGGQLDMFIIFMIAYSATNWYESGISLAKKDKV